jgi:hypothetical protein
MISDMPENIWFRNVSNITGAGHDQIGPAFARVVFILFAFPRIARICFTAGLV